MLFLYHHDSSVCAAKVRIVLAEKDLAWDGKMLDLNAGEQFNPNYIKLNPKAVVPTLVHDDRVITESNVIIEYLDDAFAEPALRPPAAYNRARMRLWLQRLDNGSSGIHHAASVISYGASYRYQLMELFGDDPDDLERAVTETMNPNSQEWLREVVRDGLKSQTFKACIRQMDELLGDFEAALGEQACLSGPDYSLADAAYTPYMARLEIMNFGDMWRARPRIAKWYERIKGRASFTEVIDHYSPEFSEVLSERGREAWPAVRHILANS